MNAWHEPVSFRLPEKFPSRRWAAVVDTGIAAGLVKEYPAMLGPGETFETPPRTLVLFRHEG
jgi:hypothetical protein